METPPGGEKRFRTHLPNQHQLGFHDRSNVINALNELSKARMYAVDANCDIWDFAVEIATLRQIGLSDADLLWLVRKNYVEQRLDTTKPDDCIRRLEMAHSLKFQSESCFVLTSSGMVFVRQVLFGRVNDLGILPLVFPPLQTNAIPIPLWDSARRQLRVADFLVKQFRWPAPNQEIVLAAFQEDGWSTRIDDPLIPTHGQDSKQRLHDTIKCLNRRQKIHLIQFRGDGTGEGIRWQYTPEGCDVLGIDVADQDNSERYG